MTRFNCRRRRSTLRMSYSMCKRRELRSILRIDSLNREVESGSLPPSVRNHVFSRIARSKNKYLRNDIIYERLFNIQGSTAGRMLEQSGEVGMYPNVPLTAGQLTCLRGHFHMDQEDVDECYRRFIRKYGRDVDKFMEIFKCRRHVAEDIIIKYI
ncbi:hypothetical protein C1646_695041 [Rhizophagus diaphanus]|nr:hypothetical protein C1646_695041 [Rhizophagus diaphanus] [Rhizophagus sp. MUCL 43196]